MCDRADSLAAPRHSKFLLTHRQQKCRWQRKSGAISLPFWFPFRSPLNFLLHIRGRPACMCAFLAFSALCAPRLSLRRAAPIADRPTQSAPGQTAKRVPGSRFFTGRAFFALQFLTFVFQFELALVGQKVSPLCLGQNAVKHQNEGDW